MRLLERDMEWKKREKLMMYFINVIKVSLHHFTILLLKNFQSYTYMLFMQALRELINFNPYLAILSAIKSANVSRLDWADKILRVCFLWLSW